ncbi:unnamed protein product, partial [Phaeothamnion confervicola]
LHDGAAALRRGAGSGRDGRAAPGPLATDGGGVGTGRCRGGSGQPLGGGGAGGGAAPAAVPRRARRRRRTFGGGRHASRHGGKADDAAPRFARVGLRFWFPIAGRRFRFWRHGRRLCRSRRGRMLCRGVYGAKGDARRRPPANAYSRSPGRRGGGGCGGNGHSRGGPRRAVAHGGSVAGVTWRLVLRRLKVRWGGRLHIVRGRQAMHFSGVRWVQ